MPRLLLFGLLVLLSALSKHSVFGVAQQGELAEQVGFDARFQQGELAELVGFDARLRQGELLVSNLDKSVWTSRQRRSRSVFGEMRTSKKLAKKLA